MTTTTEYRDLIASFGDEVIDTLTAAGYPVRNQSGDGYRVHALTEEAAPDLPQHVLIEDVREGVLYGMGGWRQMNAQRLGGIRVNVWAAFLKKELPKASGGEQRG